MNRSKAQQVSRYNLEEHVRRLATTIGERNVFRPKALAAAEAYIDETWRSQGYEIERQSYQTHGLECANLEVSRTGSVRPEEILLIGAHYDSVRGSPGADDNATGVASLLELSRVFASVEPDITVRFVAFVNEEPPFFYWGEMGSKVYATAARQRGDRIRVMISLESIGYYSEETGSQHYPPLFRRFFPDRGDFLGFVSNFASRRWMLRTVKAFRAHSGLPAEYVSMFNIVPGIEWSDHLSFWRQEYPAFMITDTALYRTPYYHTARDTPDKLDYVSLTRATDGLFHTFRELAAEK